MEVNSNRSSREFQSEVDARPIPPPKLWGYLQVLAAFFLFFNTWGIAYSFGVWQSYYSTNLLSHESDSAISWIGSIQGFLLLICGLVVGPAYDAGFGRHLVVLGAFLIVLGMMMTSLCITYWQIILAQGLVVGAGMGCLVMCSVAVLPPYFPNRNALATGIATAGGSVGSVIYPTVFHELLSRTGFAWITRIVAFIAAGTLLVSIAVFRPVINPKERRPFFDYTVLTDVPYMLFTLGLLFAFMGLYVPFFYMQEYATAIKTDEKITLYILVIMNAASIFGRIVPNIFADKAGTVNTAFISTSVSALLGFCWIPVTGSAGLIVFGIFYGFFSGTVVSIVSPALVTLSPNKALVGTHLGMTFGVASFGILIGNPVAGALLNRTGWIGVQVWCGATNLMATVFIFASRVSVSGPHAVFKV